MTDLLAILTSNAPAWGVTLTLRLDADIQKLKAVKEKAEGKK